MFAQARPIGEQTSPEPAITVASDTDSLSDDAALLCREIERWRGSYDLEQARSMISELLERCDSPHLRLFDSITALVHVANI